jgi:ribosome-associated protein YbcJ (S4-like RNA binding protein)
LLTKSTGGQQKIALMENDVILNDKKDVSDTFNSFL